MEGPGLPAQSSILFPPSTAKGSRSISYTTGNYQKRTHLEFSLITRRKEFLKGTLDKSFSLKKSVGVCLGESISTHFWIAVLAKRSFCILRYLSLYYVNTMQHCQVYGEKRAQDWQFHMVNSKRDEVLERQCRELAEIMGSEASQKDLKGQLATFLFVSLWASYILALCLNFFI